MTGRDAKNHALPGTLALALEVGRTIAQGRQEGDPIDALVNYLKTTTYYRHCKVLFDGKVTDLHRETAKGFSLGSCTIASLNPRMTSLCSSFKTSFSLRAGTVG